MMVDKTDSSGRIMLNDRIVVFGTCRSEGKWNITYKGWQYGNVPNERLPNVVQGRLALLSVALATAHDAGVLPVSVDDIGFTYGTFGSYLRLTADEFYELTISLEEYRVWPQHQKRE